MADAPPPPPLLNPAWPSDEGADEVLAKLPPDRALFASLQQLHVIASNYGLLEELAESAARSRDVFDSRQELRERNPAIPGAAKMPQLDYQEDYIEMLRTLLSQGSRWCQRALNAVWRGGAEPLDGQIAGLGAHASEFGRQLNESRRAFDFVHTFLVNPHFLIDKDVATIKHTSEWANGKLTELSTAISILAYRHAAPAPKEPVEGPAYCHADDFNWAVWNGRKYEFSKGNQAETVRWLWESWEKSGRRDGCGLSESTIASKIGSNDDRFRIQKTFRDHPALGVMIRSSGTGVYALFSAESPDYPPS